MRGIQLVDTAESEQPEWSAAPRRVDVEPAGRLKRRTRPGPPIGGGCTDFQRSHRLIGEMFQVPQRDRDRRVAGQLGDVDDVDPVCRHSIELGAVRVKVIRFTVLEGDFGARAEKPLGDVRVHDDGTLDPDPRVEDIARSWREGVKRGVTDRREVANSFVKRYWDWSNGYVISRETGNPGE